MSGLPTLADLLPAYQAAVRTIAEAQLICQLSLEFEFDWSITSPGLTDWVNQQQAPAGFRLAQAGPFRAVKSVLYEV